ncbi:MAG: TonB-dependent receptor, partial [Candidatus Neomarinimicrobiota bacterium]
MVGSLQAANISGYITAVKTGEPLSYANIILVRTDYGAATSVHGYYVITGIPPGEYTLRAMMMGYATREIPVRLTPDENLRIDLSLDVSVIQGETVTVTAERTRFENKVDVSRLNLNLREIKSAPAFIESDVFRSLQLLPGITSRNDFSAALIVRGGSPDENL